MSKKIIFVTIPLVILVAVVVYYGFTYIKTPKERYDEEVIPMEKLELNYSPFEEALDQLSETRLKELEDLILESTLATLKSHLLSGALTNEELVLFYIHRIRKYNDDYRIVIQLNPEVLNEARILDQRLVESQDSYGMLLGAAILLKDNISAINMNTTAGAMALKDLTTRRDAFLVQQLKTNDGLILGKSNLSEWANFMSEPSSNGFSTLGGQTRNPYGAFDVGGSSSGSAAGIAMNLCSLSVGSETCGSLIYPASQNSIVTLKPTTGLLSRDLIIPITEAQDTAGFMARTTEDLYTAMKATVVYDENDPLSTHVQTFDLRGFNHDLNVDYLKGKKIGLYSDNTPERNQLVKELEQLGAEVISIDVTPEPEGVRMMRVLYYGIQHDVYAYLNEPAVKSSVKSLEDVVTFNEEDMKKRAPYGQQLFDEALQLDLKQKDYDKLVADNRKICSQLIDGILKEHNLDAIVSFSNNLSVLYSAALYPAINVPAGYKEGQPYGITFMASLNEDTKLLNLAYAYELGTRHRLSPELDESTEQNE